MTQADLSKAKNPKLRGSLAAMRRAAEMARQTAIQTDTAIVVVRNGRREQISAAQLREGQG
jgi:hypothetical protein